MTRAGFYLHDIQLSIFFKLSLEGWLSVISFPFGLYGAYAVWRDRRRPRIYYATTDYAAVDQKTVTNIEPLTVFYEQTKIARLTITQVAIWYDGKDTIGAEDISTIEPLVLRVEPTSRILGITRVSETRRPVGFDMAVKDLSSVAIVRFDHLEPGDGARFQVVHDGAPSEVKIEGTVRHITRGIEYQGAIEQPGERRGRYFPVFMILFLVAVALLKSYVFTPILAKFPGLEAIGNTVGAIFVLIILVLLAVGVIAWAFNLLRSETRRMPRVLTRTKH